MLDLLQVVGIPSTTGSPLVLAMWKASRIESIMRGTLCAAT
jgi:hypothetical protein